MPFTLGFQLLNRAGLTKGECDSPLPFLAKMNGIAVNSGKIQWSAHAIRKMLERKITRNTVKQTLLTGDFIEYYPEDKP